MIWNQPNLVRKWQMSMIVKCCKYFASLTNSCPLVAKTTTGRACSLCVSIEVFFFDTLILTKNDLTNVARIQTSLAGIRLVMSTTPSESVQCLSLALRALKGLH